MDGIELTVDTKYITALSKAIKAESNSLELRKDLIVNLRAAVQPGVSAVQSKLSSIPSRGIGPSPSLSSYLSSRVKPEVKLSGRSAGVRVRIGQTPGLRGFALAARKLNRASWRHPVFGRDTWVSQDSPIPGYFDNTLSAGKDRYRAAVIKALRSLNFRLGRGL